jgi:hypothetical protein
MRIKAAGFDKLPLDERRMALDTLAALAPARAEAVCVELLGDARMLTLEAHEETRALAAQTLGKVATTRDSLRALEVASNSRWKYSERVRSSARQAHEQADVRLSQRPEPPHSQPPLQSQAPPREPPVSARVPATESGQSSAVRPPASGGVRGLWSGRRRQ